ncbi:MAG: 5-deoxy-glucuronate isomerase, partial [Hyphomonas sp.]|nr:5-deoxy-glucuronate isomerase [Hyphomonas sp.]
ADTDMADRLLVVEAITPGGNSSSYPPHKHDQDDLPRESQLEEVYFYHIRPEQGFAFQRVYTDDRSIDVAVTPEDGDVVLVPKGYHPVSAPHGYEVYYLNVMAGPKRAWKTHTAKEHAWLLDA